jgi:hypothetical protein
VKLNAKVPRIVNRFAEAFKAAGLEFHKTRPANLFIRKMAMDPAKVLAGHTLQRFERLCGLLNAAVDALEKADRAPFR